MAQGVRVWGNKNLSPDTTIETGVNDTLEIEIDGVAYTVFIPAGTYVNHLELFTSELIGAINSDIATQGLGVTAVLGGIHDDNHRIVLVLERTEVGDKTLTVTGGTAFDDVFGATFGTEPEIE